MYYSYVCILSYDHMIVRSYDRRILWSHDHMIIWSWSYDHMIIWSYDYIIMWPQGRYLRVQYYMLCYGYVCILWDECAYVHRVYYHVCMRVQSSMLYYSCVCIQWDVRGVELVLNRYYWVVCFSLTQSHLALTTSCASAGQCYPRVGLCWRTKLSLQAVGALFFTTKASAGLSFATWSLVVSAS